VVRDKDGLGKFRANEPLRLASRTRQFFRAKGTRAARGEVDLAMSWARRTDIVGKNALTVAG